MFSRGDGVNIEVQTLKNHGVNEIEIDEVITFSEAQIKEADLLDLKDVHLLGTVTKLENEDYYLEATLSGIMVLPCAITLKPVDYEFSISIDGNVASMLEEIDENYEKVENTIDILPIIWENILMEIPLRVVSEEAQDVSLHGDGWRLITEKEDNLELNPELQKLKDLL